MPKCGRRNEVPPFEGFSGGVMSEGFINKNAPFGTQYTPMIRTKIVGGKPRYVTETQRSFKLPSDKNSVVTHTHVQDDGVQTDTTQVTDDKWASSQDWQSHSILPPIPADNHPPKRSSNATATEKPPLPPIATSNGANPNSSRPTVGAEEQYRKHQVLADIPKHNKPTPPIETSSTDRQNNPQFSPKTYDSEPARDYEWKPAAGYSYLPTQPINLSHDQQMFLLRKLAEDLAGCSLAQVRNVYEEMASHDHQLTGWGSYTQLGLSLQKHGIYPNLNTLRLLASTCVSSTDTGYIDYEKLLSFLIAAVKKSKEQPSEQQNFYSPRDEGNPYSPVPDQTGSEGQLLRMVQQQLLQSKAILDVEKLRTVFSKADRSHRLTLSHTQIKDLCQRMNVPIDESVINQMIAHCRSHGDGQYIWADFIDILERVQPHATGLIIPQSKRPLEYAKKYLQPNENWPHPDPSQTRVEEKVEQAQSYSEIAPELMDNRVAQSKAPPRAVMHQISAPAGFNNRVGQSEQTHTSPRGLGLQHKNQPWSKNDPDPWFAGFKKMAEALYRNDLDKKGSMKPEKCNWLITEYNEIYDLQLPADEVTKCVHFNTTTSGTVIDGLLQHLLALKQT